MDYCGHLFYHVNPSKSPGKHTKNYGKSASFIGKSSINGPFFIPMWLCK